MIRNLTFLLTAFAAVACGRPVSDDPVDYVDPFIGTGFHGHTYPGATTPFGMVQLSPDTRANNWDACSGYHYDDATIDGFSHTHLSGTGCADLGDVLFYPTLRDEVVRDGRFEPRPYGFSHDDERASCGYYAVSLPGEGIDAELTAAPRTGVHRYVFRGEGVRRVVVDLMHTLTDETIDLRALRRTSVDELEGMRRTQGWVSDHYVFFSARFSEPMTDVELLGDRQAVLTFAPDVDTLTAAVGLSSVSAENARANREAEVPELDFDAVHERAVALWREALADIVVEGGTPEQRTNFYTAQYHTKLTPNVMSDVNGDYRRHDGTIARMPDGRHYYSTLSLWDTFRAWNPLQTLVNEELVNDMIRSMLDMYDATGELPIWPLASGETGTMIGYHAVSVIADAYVKGIRDYDADKALEAMMRSSDINAKGSDYYVAQGFIPSNVKRESVSCTLEYAYDDWAIARMARAMGRTDVAERYEARARNYANVFDGSTRFFRGRRADGGWTEPFEEFTAGRDYTEATPWQYRFFVPHDVNGMVQLFGGREEFVSALDRLFTLESPDEDMGLCDITGIKGQYAHGNEPSHHMAYLYDWVGQPWKTQELTRTLLDEMYAPTPAGIIGNEDCGQMSAWYVFSALGFYPVCPGSNEYALTAPLFERAEVRLANGRTLTVTADNPRRNRYVWEVTFNGVPVKENFIDAERLHEGGELHFALRPSPERSRGTAAEAAPYSLTQGNRVSVPYTTADLSLFTEPVEAGYGDGRSRDPLYARRLGARRVVGALCRAPVHRPVAHASGTRFQGGRGPEPAPQHRGRAGLLPAAPGVCGHGSGRALYLLRGGFLARGRHRGRPACGCGHDVRTLDRRGAAARPFRLCVRGRDPHSRAGRVGVHDAQRRRQRIVRRRPQGGGQRRLARRDRRHGPRGARSGLLSLHAALLRGLRGRGAGLGVESPGCGALRADTRGEPFRKIGAS